MDGSKTNSLDFKLLSRKISHQGNKSRKGKGERLLVILTAVFQITQPTPSELSKHSWQVVNGSRELRKYHRHFTYHTHAFFYAVLSFRKKKKKGTEKLFVIHATTKKSPSLV